MKSLIGASILACLLLTLPSVGANAQTVLINENWEGYTPGGKPVSPWNTPFGGGTDPAPSETTIVSQEIGGSTSNWALIGNNATNEPVSNPSLRGMYTPTSAVMNASFSFMIPANYGNISQQQFSLGNISPDGQVTKAAIVLYLGPNYLGSNSMLGIKTSSNTRVNVGGNFVAGQQVNVSLLNIDRTTGLYDLEWSTSGGASGLLTDIAFTLNVTEPFNFISFGESSGVGSTSLMYVDNIQVSAVPEPGSLALCLGASLSLLLFRRRRCG